jgi:hypothetical protein
VRGRDSIELDVGRAVQLRIGKPGNLLHVQPVLGLFRLCLRAFPRLQDRQQSGRMDHVAPIDVAEVVPRLIEGTTVVRCAMGVRDEDPAEPLLDQLGHQVHEDAPQHQHVPTGARYDRLRERLGETLIPIAVREDRQIGAVLLQNSARKNHHRLLPVQAADLLRIELRHPVNAGLRGRRDKQ